MNGKSLEEIFAEAGGATQETTPDSGRSLEEIFSNPIDESAPQANPFLQQLGIQPTQGGTIMEAFEPSLVRQEEFFQDVATGAQSYARNIAQGIRTRPISTATEVVTDISGGLLKKGASKLSPVGRGAFGALQSIPITVAKEIEEFANITPDDEKRTWFGNFQSTLIEQAGAAAAAPVLKYLAPKLGVDLKDFRETDVLQDRPTDSLFSGKTAADVEEGLFGGEAIFTAAERTRGLVGTGERQAAEKAAVLQKTIDPSRSKAIERVNKINTAVDSAIKKSFETGEEVSTDTLKANFKGSVDATLDGLKRSYEEALNTSTKFARKPVDDTARVISYRNIEDSFGVENIAELEAVMGGEKQANELLEFIHDMRKGRGAGGIGVEIKNELTPVQATRIYRKMWSAAVGDDQKEAAFLTKFMPEFRRFMSEAASKSDDGATDEVIETFVNTLDRGNALVGFRSSPTKKLFDQLENETLNEEALIKRIVRNPKHFSELTRNMNAYGLDAQRLIPEAAKGLVRKKLQAGRDNLGSTVKSLYGQIGKEELETVLGRDAVDTLDNLGAYSELTKFGRDLSNIDVLDVENQTALKQSLQVIQNLFASPASPIGKFTPRTQITGLDGLIQRNYMRLLGITDEKALEKAMLTPIGQQFTKQNLLTSDGYEIYKAFARQIGSKPINAGAFQDAVEQMKQNREKEIEGLNKAEQFFSSETQVDMPEGAVLDSPNTGEDPLGKLIGGLTAPSEGDGLVPPPETQDEIGNLIGENSLSPFTEVIAQVENSVRKGFDGEVWKPHASPEGGNDTIAYGHKLTDDEVSNGTVNVSGQIVPLAQGLTEYQAKTLLEQDIDVAKTGLQEKWTNFNLLPEKYQNVLVNIAFNVGVSGAEPTKWPRLARAMMAGDDKVVRKEMVTAFTDEAGNKRQLTERAEQVADAVGLGDAESRMAAL